MTAVAPTPVEHHLVSQGYQRNFSAPPGFSLAIFQTATGDALGLRGVRKNWRAPHFNSFRSAEGHADTSLEVAWARLERSTLNRVRDIRANESRPGYIAAAAELCALHLVRSHTFRGLYEKVAGGFREHAVEGVVDTAAIRTAFLEQEGREPEPGELNAIGEQILAEGEESNWYFVSAMARQFDKIAEKIVGFRMQVITIPERFPGVILGDVPVVHANLAQQRYGFRDGLALGDADLIIGPIDRRRVVCFATRNNRHTEVRSKKQVQAINALFWRAARDEVACHPDDQLETSRLYRNLDRLPPDLLRP